MSTPLPPNTPEQNLTSRKLLFGLGMLGSLASSGLSALRQHETVDQMVRKIKRAMSRRQTRQHPGTYRGCKKNKFANLTRQRLRWMARQEIKAQVLGLQLPDEDLPFRRRILRAILRDRVNREWRDFGKVQAIRGRLSYSYRVSLEKRARLARVTASEATV